MMKSKTLIFTSVASLALSLPCFAFDAKLAESGWDGKKVPEGAQCQKFGGDAISPKISVSDIPQGANLIVLEFSDDTYEPMSNGGHGKVAYALRQSELKEVVVPSFPGHTFTLPAGFTMVAAHKSPNWDTAGAYMPPCSGGKGNDYSVKVKAVQFDGSGAKVLAEQKVVLGKY